MASGRAIGRLTPQTTAFFLCDVQERFASIIHHFDSVVHIARRMTDAAKLLNIPVIGTQQYPRAFGQTVSSINTSDVKMFDKMTFSMIGEPEIKDHLTSLNVKNAVLFGIEAHVCVQQTALDLLEQGYNVTILGDGTSSSRNDERLFAFERMRQSGAFVSTSESVLFELMRTAKVENFKQVSALLKDARPQENPFQPNAALSSL
eukprot:TRINITY_DN9544_c0_g1_i1.p1 TRINITY_DN9544_c0_g1~~TRINITY_DN9544_c0_g1_i1.p1  ORF type:complete len:204 (-),score=51.98 TRINITY_DN9544_c0_g1_i1:185-796(-)